MMVALLRLSLSTAEAFLDGVALLVALGAVLGATLPSVQD